MKYVHSAVIDARTDVDGWGSNLPQQAQFFLKVRKEKKKANEPSPGRRGVRPVAKSTVTAVEGAK